MEKQVAVLIDGDNISPKYAEYIKQEAMHYGNVRVFRLYGSITTPNVRSWYKVMPLQGITPMLQISYADKKSIADQALTIDAMDLLYSNCFDVFLIVSSDCDFTKLVYRLKEAGKAVVGMGEKKTKEALAKACDEFKILDLIYKDIGEGEESGGTEIPEDLPSGDKEDQESVSEGPEDMEIVDGPEISIPKEEEILSFISEIIELSDDERINLAEIGGSLKQKYLGFDARNYGYKNMTKMVQSHKDMFVVEREKTQDGIHGVVYVRKK